MNSVVSGDAAVPMGPPSLPPLPAPLLEAAVEPTLTEVATVLISDDDELFDLAGAEDLPAPRTKPVLSPPPHLPPPVRAHLLSRGATCQLPNKQMSRLSLSVDECMSYVVDEFKGKFECFSHWAPEQGASICVPCFSCEAQAFAFFNLYHASWHHPPVSSPIVVHAPPPRLPPPSPPVRAPPLQPSSPPVPSLLPSPPPIASSPPPPSSHSSASPDQSPTLSTNPTSQAQFQRREQQLPDRSAHPDLEGQLEAAAEGLRVAIGQAGDDDDQRQEIEELLLGLEEELRTPTNPSQADLLGATSALLEGKSLPRRGATARGVLERVFRQVAGLIDRARRRAVTVSPPSQPTTPSASSAEAAVFNPIEEEVLGILFITFLSLSFLGVAGFVCLLWRFREALCCYRRKKPKRVSPFEVKKRQTSRAVSAVKRALQRDFDATRRGQPSSRSSPASKLDMVLEDAAMRTPLRPKRGGAGGGRVAVKDVENPLTPATPSSSSSAASTPPKGLLHASPKKQQPASTMTRGTPTVTPTREVNKKATLTPPSATSSTPTCKTPVANASTTQQQGTPIVTPETKKTGDENDVEQGRFVQSRITPKVRSKERKDDDTFHIQPPKPPSRTTPRRRAGRSLDLAKA